MRSRTTKDFQEPFDVTICMFVRLDVIWSLSSPGAALRFCKALWEALGDLHNWAGANHYTKLCIRELLRRVVCNAPIPHLRSHLLCH